MGQDSSSLARKRYAEAMTLFNDSTAATGYQASLAYNVALCYYSSKQYGPALKNIAEIIERGVREHPELSVGALSEGELKARSVGNSSAACCQALCESYLTKVLRETALIEAFNLKSAIERLGHVWSQRLVRYMTKNMEAAKDALADMPPRDEAELDAVTLHNQALLEMDEKPTEGFRRVVASRYLKRLRKVELPIEPAALSTRDLCEPALAVLQVQLLRPRG